MKSENQSAELSRYVRAVPDFPKPGILFRDVSPLLASPEAFRQAVSQMAAPWRGRVDAIAGLDARGFVFGAAVALELGLPLILVRKKGKLPGPVESIDYDLEYGSASLEIARDSVSKGASVLVVDDLLATGGTARAAQALLEKSGAVVEGFAFAIGLADLPGFKNLEPKEISCLLTY